MTETKDNVALTVAQRKLLDASTAIFGDRATAKEAAFIARQLVQATLPHKNPGNVPLWKRTNGNITLAIQAGMDVRTGKSFGYPYGTVPRLLLFWLTTEALRNKGNGYGNPRRLELGSSLSGFMTDIGLNPTNGSSGAKRSDARRLRDQMLKLFRARITFETIVEQDGRVGEARRDMLIADETVFWWDAKSPDQTALWGSWIELGEKFFTAITAAAVPVDVRAIKALKGSALALDLYSWLIYEAYRANKNKKPRFENWEQLHSHFGGEYTEVRNFRLKANAALRKIKAVYPGLKLGKRQGGIEILPESLTALQPRLIFTLPNQCKTL
jgi:hypothetical protein